MFKRITLSEVHKHLAAKLLLRLRSAGWLSKQQPDKVPSLLVAGSDPDQIDNHQLLSLGESGAATQREPSGPPTYNLLCC